MHQVLAQRISEFEVGIQTIRRRLVTLRRAEAEISTLARSWGVLIAGYIGKHPYRALEEFSDWPEACRRCSSINGDGVALVVSIDEILFPEGYPVAIYKPVRVNSVPKGTYY